MHAAHVAHAAVSGAIASVQGAMAKAKDDGLPKFKLGLWVKWTVWLFAFLAILGNLGIFLFSVIEASRLVTVQAPHENQTCSTDMKAAVAFACLFYVCHIIYAICVVCFIHNADPLKDDYRDLIWGQECLGRCCKGVLYLIIMITHLLWSIGAPWRCGVQAGTRCWRSRDPCSGVVMAGVFATWGQWVLWLFVLLWGVVGRYQVDKKAEERFGVSPAPAVAAAPAGGEAPKDPAYRNVGY